MGSEWKESTLGELVDFTPKRTIKKGSIAPFVAMADLRENHREILCVTEKEYKGGGSRFANGDTLFARITPCLENGKTALAKNLPDGFIAHGSTEFIIMAARLSEYDREFIYYLARHPDFRKFAESRMEGTSGRQRVSWQSLSDYPISLPSPSEQKAIAHILGTLDDKIELNRRMNATLEGMAQALFKSWFVDFDPVIDNALAAGNPIPDEFASRARLRAAHRQAEVRQKALGERISSCVSSKKDGAGAPSLPGTTQQGSVDRPTLSDPKSLFPAAFQFTEDLGWIPEGWEAKPLSEAIQINPSVKLSKGTVAQFADMKALPTSGYAIDGVIDKEYSGGAKFQNDDVLFARITPCLENGKTGIVDSLSTPEEVGFGSTEFIVLRGKGDLTLPYVASLARDETFRLHCKQSMVGSSGRQRVQNACFDSFHVAIPTEPSALQCFDNIATPMFQKSSEHRIASGTVTKLRDSLLPKLVSGQLQTLKKA